MPTKSILDRVYDEFENGVDPCDEGRDESLRVLRMARSLTEADPWLAFETLRLQALDRKETDGHSLQAGIMMGVALCEHERRKDDTNVH